jgi:hypothetical protein
LTSTIGLLNSNVDGVTSGKERNSALDVVMCAIGIWPEKDTHPVCEDGSLSSNSKVVMHTIPSLRKKVTIGSSPI